jgi:hypothetical protein
MGQLDVGVPVGAALCDRDDVVDGRSPRIRDRNAIGYGLVAELAYPAIALEDEAILYVFNERCLEKRAASSLVPTFATRTRAVGSAKDLQRVLEAEGIATFRALTDLYRLTEADYVALRAQTLAIMLPVGMAFGHPRQPGLSTTVEKVLGGVRVTNVESATDDALSVQNGNRAATDALAMSLRHLHGVAPTITNPIPTDSRAINSRVARKLTRRRDDSATTLTDHEMPPCSRH